MRKIIAFFLALVFLVNTATGVWAVQNPLQSPNNRFGIHITDENDLEKARQLVNSNGGDWGYVTLVIREDERDTLRWQKVLDEMRRQHLIPIIRIATTSKDGVWQKPSLEPAEIEKWTSFLGSLNWVVQNRYVVIGNEPNHAKEWGGEVAPEEYAEYATAFSAALKKTSEDFFILPAGLDASAGYSRQSLPLDIFLRQALEHQPNFFEHIDGWNSHSYPNPGFAGSPEATGRGSVQSFAWELNFVKSLGVQKDLPVFITETGWIHDEKGQVLGANTQVGTNLVSAFAEVWNDPRVVAVTPFILSYQEEPFTDFSWTKPDGGFYDFYYTVKDISKTQGSPEQITAAKVSSLSTFQVGHKTYGSLNIKNTGQAIWETEKLNLLEEDGTLGKVNSFQETIEPGQGAVLFFETESQKTSLIQDKKVLAQLDLPQTSPFFSWVGLVQVIGSIW